MEARPVRESEDVYSAVTAALKVPGVTGTEVSEKKVGTNEDPRPSADLEFP